MRVSWFSRGSADHPQAEMERRDAGGVANPLGA
jgi:hypothetical protein